MTTNRQRIAAWLGEPGNLAFAGLMVFVIALRLYYFDLTRNQPLWWDEAEYMLKAKALALGTPETGWTRGRPVLLPFLAAALFKAGLGEMAIRLLWIALSAASLCLAYCTARTLFSPQAALYALAFGSAFYLDLFYSTRLLVDWPQVFFVVLAAHLLVSALVRHEATGRRVWAIVPVLALGTAMRFTAGLFVAVLGAFLLSISGASLLRAREWRISLALGVLTFAPFLVYFWSAYGNPIAPFVSQVVFRDAAGANPAQSAAGPAAWRYLTFFPSYGGVLVAALFVAGLVHAIAFVARRARDIRQNLAAQGYLLLLLWIVVPFLFFGFLVNHFEDRYLAMIFPAVFILAGAALDRAHARLKRFHPAAAAAAVAVVMIYSIAAMALGSDALLRSSLLSFAEVRNAGLWIKERTQPGDAIVGSSVPQNTYYSERPTFAYPKTEADFERLLSAEKPKYLVLSEWQKSPQWTYAWPEKHPEKASLASVFVRDRTDGRPMVLVYALGDKER